MYMEDLINEIEQLDQGAYLYNMKIDILMYADDILLLSNTQDGLQKMLNITQRYGEKWEIKFNPDKTTYMIFGNNNKKICSNEPIFDGIRIKKVKKMKYLGVVINEKNNNKEHLINRKNMTYSAIQKLNSIGFNLNHLKYNIKSILYKTHIRPVLFYGMETHTLNATELKNLQILESSVIKREMGLTKKGKNKRSYVRYGNRPNITTNTTN